jgi:hypothetical protein
MDVVYKPYDYILGKLLSVCITHRNDDVTIPLLNLIPEILEELQKLTDSNDPPFVECERSNEWYVYKIYGQYTSKHIPVPFLFLVDTFNVSVIEPINNRRYALGV